MMTFGGILRKGAAVHKTLAQLILYSLLIFGGACARQAEQDDEQINNIKRQAAVVEQNLLRYCIGSKQIVHVLPDLDASEASERKREAVVEDIFAPNTIISTIEGPVTYCLRMQPNSENSRFDTFLRLEVEDALGTTTLPYRSLSDAFFADVWRTSSGERIVNAIFWDSQGLVEVYARGNNDQALVGDITYYNFMTFSESLEKALNDAKRKAQQQKPAQNIFLFSNPFAGMPMSEKDHWDKFTTLMDSSEAVQLGTIVLDLRKSLEE